MRPGQITWSHYFCVETAICIIVQAFGITIKVILTRKCYTRGVKGVTNMTDKPEKPKTTFKKIRRGMRGSCPQCHHEMTIYYGMNHCPSCGYLFKSNFIVK